MTTNLSLEVKKNTREEELKHLQERIRDDDNSMEWILKKWPAGDSKLVSDGCKG